MLHRYRHYPLLCLLFVTVTGIELLGASPALGVIVEYHLEIAYQEVNYTGKATAAMTINDSVPGPVLRFRQGDLARIHVTNRMDVDTSIHWHGILVPPGMDGVPFISFPPIAPGQTFTYEFPIRQDGTYWYHSHSGLQEQRGVYGPIVIEPLEQQHKVDRDYVVLLSDWTDDAPNQVLRTLKRGSEWFALEKGSAQSIFGAARLGMLGDYFKRELQRMPAMDIADVAYDLFLANGQPVTRLEARAGELVRLRIIDGSATTYFHLEFASGPVRIIAADGIDVETVQAKRFLIAVAETYDVLIRMPDYGSYEFRATAHDGSGFATIFLGDGDAHQAPAVPRPNLYHSMDHFNVGNLFSLTPAGVMGMDDAAVDAGMFDRPGMMTMEGMHDSGGKMKGNDMMKNPSSHPMQQDDASGDKAKGSTQHSMPTHGGGMTTGHSVAMTPEKPAGLAMTSMEKEGEQVKQPSAKHEKRNARPFGTNFRLLAADVSAAKNLAMDGMEERPWPLYDRLRAKSLTTFAGSRPVREIRLTLDGDMERYVWFLNNRPLSESDSILIREGEAVRFIMINRTMMHHPFHLHGHFFRVINGQGDHAPLKHTVDVAPMSTTVIEFDADESGDWFFHCHLLYHMKAGMARMVHYENYSPPLSVTDIRSQLYRESWYFWGEAEVLSNMTEGFVRAANTRHTLSATWEYGWQDVDENEWEVILAWDYYINRFFTVFTGIDMLGEGTDEENTLGVFGFTYLLPLNIESSWWLDTDGGGRFLLEKEFTLTPRLALAGEVEYDTHDSEWESKIGLEYVLTKSVSLTGSWHSNFGWGLGAAVRF